MTLSNVINWMGKAHHILIILKELQASVESIKWENCLPQGRTHQLVIQYQMITPENIHISNVTQMEQLYLGMYVYMHISMDGGKDRECCNYNLKKVKHLLFSHRTNRVHMSLYSQYIHKTIMI